VNANRLGAGGAIRTTRRPPRRRQAGYVATFALILITIGVAFGIACAIDLLTDLLVAGQSQ
jgi:hypothetical protein